MLAVASVAKQEIIKQEIPLTERLTHRIVELPLESRAPRRELLQGNDESALARTDLPSFIPEGPIEIIERAHPELGRLGVFWHTQGSGKSYSMVFFSQKVLRKLPGNWTFVIVTDREDLDGQIYRNFALTGAVLEDVRLAVDREDHRTLVGVRLVERSYTPPDKFAGAADADGAGRVLDI